MKLLYPLVALTSIGIVAFAFYIGTPLFFFWFLHRILAA